MYLSNEFQSAEDKLTYNTACSRYAPCQKRGKAESGVEQAGQGIEEPTVVVSKGEPSGG